MSVEETFNALVGDLEYPMFIVTAQAGRRAAGLPRRIRDADEHPPAALPGLPVARQPHVPPRPRRRRLGVHCVPEDAGGLAELFGGETGDAVDKFARVPWHEGPEGVPLLDDCANRFVGRVVERMDAGDHTAFLLEPVARRARRRRGRVHLPPREADRARAPVLSERFQRLLPDYADGLTAEEIASELPRPPRGERAVPGRQLRSPPRTAAPPSPAAPARSPTAPTTSSSTRCARASTR